MTAPVPKPRAPIEAKAQAATGGAFAAGIIIWALQTWVFKGSSVPAGLVSLVYAVVPAALTLAAAYFAPHTPRPAPPATNIPPSQAVHVIPPAPPPAS